MIKDRWAPGERIVKREILRGQPWLGLSGYVVADDDADGFVFYVPPGAEIGYVDGKWPTATGRHPWQPSRAWRGPGVLMVHRPGELHAVWHFWHRDGSFMHWYINIQEPFRRTSVGFDTQDLELDLVVRPDGSWEFKDREVMAARVAEGRFTQSECDAIVEEGDRIAARLASGERWWDERWHEWAPDPAWTGYELPSGWADAPVPPAPSLVAGAVT